MITAMIETITPTMAKDYLNRNTDNFRKISNSLVSAYASDMANGKWQLNGEAIQFGEDGALMNGQHRLAAIIKANTPIKMLVVRGVDNRHEVMYDIGQKRTMGQYGQHLGIKSANMVMAIANNMVQNMQNGRASQPRVYEYGVKHAEEILRATYITQTGGSKSCLMKKAPIMTVIYCAIKCGGVDEQTAANFCRIVNSGNILEGDTRNPSPALVLRRQIMDASANGRFEGIKIAELTYKALTDYQLGKSRTKNYLTDPPVVRDLIRRVYLMDRVV